MRIKAVSGIMLTLLLTSMLTLASPAKADPYAYDGPWDTDRWIILENTTLTNDVSFADWGIIIDADNITLDLNGYTVRGPGSGWDVGVRVNGRTGVTVKNGRIEGFRAGIGVYTAWVSWGVYRKSVDVTVEGNIVTDNLGDGIFLNAHDSTVIGNIVTNNSGVGVNISPDAARNTIRENYISNNGWGIRLQGGDYNSISANRITNNQYGIWFDSHQSIPITNSISGNNITANNGHGIHLEGSFRTSIFRNNITANLGAGIYLWGSIGETISGNNIINNYDGIYSRSAGNSISANNITANENYGILLEYSHDATLRNNKLANNKYNFGVLGIILDPMFSNFVHDIDASNTVDGKPIYYWVNSQDMNVPLEAGYVGLVNCTYITVQNLNLSNNVQGLLLAGTANSTIAENGITNNQYGVQLFSSSGNTVSLNKIANNNNRGVDLQYSSDNKFYHNNFIDNTQQVTTDGSSNVWDDGYPSGGNYWSDYGYRYPDAQELDGSGIWDTPYVIDSDNVDRYPLIEPVTGLISRTIRIVDVTTGLDSVTLGTPTEPMPLDGYTFTVNIALNGTTNYFHSFQVAIAFDNTKVKCNTAWIPKDNPSFVFYGAKFLMSGISVYNDEGLVVLHSSLSSDYVVDGYPIRHYVNVTGDTLFGQINFTAIKLGASTLEIITTQEPIYPTWNTVLIDKDNNPIDFTAEKFSVTTIALEPLHALTFNFTVGEETYRITTLNNSTISEFNFNQNLKQISFNVTGPTGTSGFCNVTIPEDLIWGEFSLFMDGSLLVEDVDYTQTYNGTHCTFYITYSHTTKTVEIIGRDVIPEFPTWTPMLLILILLSIAIAIYKRRLLKTPIH